MASPTKAETLGRAGIQAIVSRNPDIHHGDAVFAGSRVPVWTLVDYLAAGESIEAFLEEYPSVDRRQVLEALELLRVTLTSAAD